MESCTIYSMDGDVLHHFKGENKRLNVSELSPGLYLIKLDSDQGIFTYKFIKN